MKAVDRLLPRNARRVRPGRSRLGTWMSNDLEQQSVWITKAEDLLRLAVTNGASNGRLVSDAMPNEPLDPESDGTGQHREGRHGDLARTHASAPRARPGEEGHDTPRCTHLVAVIEMV